MVGISNNPFDFSRWSAVALETPEKNIAAILDNHGHQFLGEFDDFEQAQEVAKAFAKQWGDKRDAIDRCACKPIKRARRSSSPKTSGVTN